MKRKVIRLSKSTSVISLPTTWLKKNNVKKGEELVVDEKENNLIISREEKLVKKSSSFSLKDVDEDSKGNLVWLIIDAFYMNGYDELTIETKNHAEKSRFVKIVHYFPGLIIFEEKGDIIKLKNIATQEDFDISQLLSRIRNLTISLIDDSINAIKESEWEILLAAKKRDYIINTYVSMAFRRINLYGYMPASSQGVISQHIKFLEIFADRLCILLEKIGREKNKSKIKSKVVIDILQGIRDLYREEAVLLSKFSLKKLSDFNKKKLELISRASKERNFQKDLLDILQIFNDIEESATQLNVALIGK